jgi:hypothetical protein
MLSLNRSISFIEIAETDVVELLRSSSPFTLSRESFAEQPCDAFVCAFREDDQVQVQVAIHFKTVKKNLVYVFDEQSGAAKDYRKKLDEAVAFLTEIGFDMESMNLNYSPALREVILRGIQVLRPISAAKKAASDRIAAEKTEARRIAEEKAAAEEAEARRIAEEKAAAEEAEARRIAEEKAAAEEAEARRIAEEKAAAEEAEARRIAEEKAAAEEAEARRIAEEKAAAEEAEARRIAEEKAAAEEAEARRIAEEKAAAEEAEARRIAEEKAAAEEAEARSTLAEMTVILAELQDRFAADQDAFAATIEKFVAEEQEAAAILTAEKEKAEQIAEQLVKAEQFVAEMVEKAKNSETKAAASRKEEEAATAERIRIEEAFVKACEAERAAAEMAAEDRRVAEQALAETLEATALVTEIMEAEATAAARTEAAQAAIESARSERLQTEEASKSRAEDARVAIEAATAARGAAEKALIALKKKAREREKEREAAQAVADRESEAMRIMALQEAVKLVEQDEQHEVELVATELDSGELGDLVLVSATDSLEEPDIDQQEVPHESEELPAAEPETETVLGEELPGIDQTMADYAFESDLEDLDLPEEITEIETATVDRGLQITSADEQLSGEALHEVFPEFAGAQSGELAPQVSELTDEWAEAERIAEARNARKLTTGERKGKDKKAEVKEAPAPAADNKSDFKRFLAERADRDKDFVDKTELPVDQHPVDSGDPFAFMAGSGTDFGGNGGHGSGGATFQLDRSRHEIEFSRPDEVLELYQSTNAIQSALEGNRNQKCNGYITVVKSGKSLSVSIAIYLTEKNSSLIYLPDHQPKTVEDSAGIVNDAVLFLELMGFMIDPMALSSDSAKRGAFLAAIPVLRRTSAERS